MYSFVETMNALELQISAKRQRVPKLQHSALENMHDDESNDNEQEVSKKKNKVCIYLLYIILILVI